MKDLQTRQRFVELRAEGWSYARIAAELKVSKPTLISWAKQYAAEIGNLKTLELDSLMERLAVAKRGRVEAFAEILTAARADLKRRLEKSEGFFAVSDDKLVDLMLKLGARLQTEEAPAAFQREEKTVRVTESDPTAELFTPEAIESLMASLPGPKTSKATVTSEAWPAA